MRQQSPGLTFKDIRAMQATVPGARHAVAAQTLHAVAVMPKPQGELPVVYGVEPNYQQIAGLKIAAGRFFTQDEASHAAPVCVLGEAARVRLFGLTDPLGQFVKVNGQWYQAIGVAGPQAVARRRTSPACPAQDRNNVLYVPTGAAMFRLEDNYSQFRDEIDGVYLRLKPDADVLAAAATVRGILSRRTAAPTITRWSCRRSCWPSSSAPSASSTSSWSRSRRSRCWSAASAS